MYCFRKININHFNSLLLLFVALHCYTKSNGATQCSKIHIKTKTVILSSTGANQQYGLKPIIPQLYSYNQTQNLGSVEQLMPSGDISYVGCLDTKTSSVTYNGDKGTTGLIALLFPFHGFT